MTDDTIKAEARKEAEALLAQAQEIISKAESLADKHGFDLFFHGREYVPLHTDESTWKSSDDIDFQWSESNQGSWVSSSDWC